MDTFAYISLNAMIPQEADKTHIEYGFPVCLVQMLTVAYLKSSATPTGLVVPFAGLDTQLSSRAAVTTTATEFLNHSFAEK